MKKLLISLISLIISVTTFANNVQSGYVKTRGRLGANGQIIPGKRLGAATIVIQSGSSVQSDNSGNFSLKVPASKFYLKDIKKVGYIVSDPDILSKQYACNSNPLILVLDEPTTQQDDRLASERQLRRNLQKQLQQREDEIETLKEENRITQEQYREALQKLYADQESNEKFIAEMAERYSRIDYDQLDEFQRQIATFIQNGELVRADSLLRTKGSIEDRIAELNHLNQAIEEEQIAIDNRQQSLDNTKHLRDLEIEEIAADCYNHFEICKLRFDNDSAAYYLKLRINADPENVNYKIDYGDYLRNYLALYNQALDCFQNALIMLKEENLKKAELYNSIGSTYCFLGNYSKGKQYHELAFDVLKHINETSGYELANTYLCLGGIECVNGNYTNALNLFKQALDISENTLGPSSSGVATCYLVIGRAYGMMKERTLAIENYMKAIEIYKEYSDEQANLASCANNIGVELANMGCYEEAIQLHKAAIEKDIEIFGKNHPSVANNYCNLGCCEVNIGLMEDGLNHLKEALKIYLAFVDENHPNVITINENIQYINKLISDKNKLRQEP